MAVYGDHAFVTDVQHRVQMFEKRWGTFVREWGSHGDGPGQFNVSVGMAISEEGELWVCDQGNFRLQCF